LKSVAILGSTGSIGTNTLDVISHLCDSFRVASLAAGRNWRLLAEQARTFQPKLVALHDVEFLPAVRHELSGTGIEVVGGDEGVSAAATVAEADIAVVAVVGAAGLPASYAALCAGKTLALANKETLVMAGELLMCFARDRSVTVLPIDSEHSAIFQCLRSGIHSEIDQLLLTASGGPFRRFSRSELRRVTPEMALRHPTWNMGAKVTVDSATLTNKALEVIEARWLFDVPADRIKVVVHPQSIVHSLIEFRDGSCIAQLGVPDMRVPIQYALTHPRRLPGRAATLHLADVKSLTFEPPDTDRFPGLLLGWRAAREGGTAGAVLNAANEVAVGLFLNRRIGFADITTIATRVMDAHTVTHPGCIEDVLDADAWARARANEVASSLAP
jgi:1-deoxy-D-xylulose-5-phosphate reductoisomerase